MRVTDAAAEVKVSPKIEVDWYNFFQDSYAEHFLANPITLILVVQRKLLKSMSLISVSICVQDQLLTVGER